MYNIDNANSLIYIILMEVKISIMSTFTQKGEISFLEVKIVRLSRKIVNISYSN